MSPVDPEIVELQNDIYRRKVLRARRQSVGEKIADGISLFRLGMGFMRGSIRSDHPEWTEQQIEAEVDRRLRIGKKLSDGHLYRDAGVLDE